MRSRKPTLHFVTGNARKANEVAHLMRQQDRFEVAQHDPEFDIPELQDLDPNNVALAKLSAVLQENPSLVDALRAGNLVGVEDTSLVIAAYNHAVMQRIHKEEPSADEALYHGLPGTLIRFFSMRGGNEGILSAVRAFGEGGDWALARTTVAVAYRSDRFELRRTFLTPGREQSLEGFTLATFAGEVTGRIVEPRGVHGFDWDPIFQPDEHTKTFAEMTPAEKRRHKMRGRAFRAFLHALKEQSSVSRVSA